MNLKKTYQAHNVRIVLTKLARPRADNTFPNYELISAIQLNWTFGKYQPQFPTIGPDMKCDLGFLTEDENFILSTIFRPNNFVNILRPNEKIRLEIFATSDEVNSPPLYLEIAWDGKWVEDTNEMLNHLVIKEVDGI